MADLFGLDFGTTNSLAARVLRSGQRLEPVAYADRTGQSHPSVVAYHGDRVIVGREAFELLDRSGTGVIGDAVRSPKSYLGTGSSLTVAGVAREPRELAAAVLDHVVRESSAQAPDRSFTDAVMTIPVDMDGRGRRELREAARDVGLRIHQFVHEPLAALYAYLRRDDDLQRALAMMGSAPILVVDWGGGTLDLTLCRVVGNTLVQIENRGEHRVGGDRFDELLRNLVRRRHVEEHGLRTLEPLQIGAAARLLTRCEQAKKTLSTREDALVFVASFLAVDGPSADIEVEVSRADLEAEAGQLIDIAMEGMTRTLDSARVGESELGLVLLTGGMSRMPLVQHALERRFGIERVPSVEEADRLIAYGAAYVAHDERSLQLAKPFEVTLADDHPAELVAVGTDLPLDENIFAERFPVHCVDPRDGHARLVFTRPVEPGMPQTHDPRRTYATLMLPVDPERAPLEERLDVDVVIDADLVVTVTAHSQLSGRMATREIHQLEFGLGLGRGEEG